MIAAAALFAIHGFLDGGYIDEPDLQLAAIELAREAAPAGFHLSLIAGKRADINRTHVYHASVEYKASPRLTLEGGVYPSHIGFETLYSKDDWNYTRGWLAELSPYYQTGVKAHYAFDSHWSGEVHLLNGWQTIGARLHAAGTQIAWSSDRFSASFNTFADADRKFGDLVALYKATPKLSVGGSIDRGYQAGADWLGVAGYGRYALSDRHAVAVRAERFSDPDNGISGAAQTLTEETLTYEYRPKPKLILKLEARRDHAKTRMAGGAVVTF